MRSIVYCHRCHRWRYGALVRVVTAQGQDDHQCRWLCRLCRDRASALVQAAFLAALAHQTPTTIISNPDGTITGIWVSHPNSPQD
jgi:hypothetical protein